LSHPSMKSLVGQFALVISGEKLFQALPKSLYYRSD
jgi:hypothetical protein